MKVITIAGPSSSGKTGIILKTIEELRTNNVKTGVVKFDCLSAQDAKLYEECNVPVKTGLSGGLCPDHFFVSNIEAAILWGKEEGFEYLFTESAGLCNRCSPHIKELLAVCVIDTLSGVNTPKKIGPMLKMADIVVITKDEVINHLTLFISEMESLTRNSTRALHSITKLPGFDNGKRKEKHTIILNKGEVCALVGSTGSGKTRVLEDIETLAQKDTLTGRMILINDHVPDDETRFVSEESLTFLSRHTL